MDAELEVTLQTGFRNLFVAKQKDGEDGQHYAFTLKPIPLYVNQYGEAVSSCVVEHIEPTAVARLTAGQQQVFNAIRAFAEDRDSFTIAELTEKMLSEHLKRLAQADPPEQPPQDGGRNFRSTAISKKIPSYLDLPDCGVEVSGDFSAKNAHEVVVTITDLDKFIV